MEYWHLIKPKHFEPGINTPEGISMAASVCLEAAPPKINRPNLDHSIYTSVISIGSSLYRSGVSIAGKKAERYDVVVKGTSFYKSSGADLVAVNFTCLLSPMLEIKKIQHK
jgi:hypothetical protein